MVESETGDFVFDWKLNPQDAKTSIFLKVKCFEDIPIDKIYGFLHSGMGVNYDNWNFENEQQLIKKYKSKYNKKIKKFITTHHLAKHKWGRTQPSGYLSSSIFHRPTRHSLCDENYIDIDMKNSHPQLVKEIAIMNNINVPYLIKYCDNPKKYKKKIEEHHKCSKDVAKKLVLAILFGGKYTSWIKDNDININDTRLLQTISGIQDEMKTIMEIVYANNQKIKDDVLKQDPTKWRNEGEKKRGTMGLWGQTIEKMIQETVINFLVENKDFKLCDIIPSQDGFMILKNLYYEDLLNDLKIVVKEKYNINLDWERKPFDEKIEIPSYTDVKTFDEWDDLLSSKCLADRFILEFGDYIVKNDKCIYIYYGDKNETGDIINGRWYDETGKDKYKLTRLISEDLYNLYLDEINNAIELDDKELPKLLKTLRNQTSKGFNLNDIIKHILTKAKSSNSEFDSNPFLLGFDNGVYDLEKGIFRDYTFNDYITLSTRYDYKELKDDEETKSKKIELDNILDTIHPDPECKLLFLQVLASGLDGRPYQKLFLFNGAGGNGKGLTGSFMDNTLGDYYLQPSNGILKDVEKSNNPSPDMYNLKNKRYINFKEVAGSVRVAMLRNLTGGGKFTGRLLHSNPVNFFMTATFCMEFNNAPELDGKPQRADYRRLVDLFFPVNFTDDPEKIGKEIGGVKYAEANTYYETTAFLESMRYIFLHKLLDIYKEHRTEDKGIIFTIPASIRKRTEQFIENQNLFQKVFNDNFERVEIIENDKDDEKRKTLRLKEIWDNMVCSDEYKNLSYRDKRQYGRNEFYNWMAEHFKIEGTSKTGKLVKGLKMKFQEENEVDELDSDDDTTIGLNGKCYINPLDA